jgi:hypothetical protein
MKVVQEETGEQLREYRRAKQSENDVEEKIRACKKNLMATESHLVNVLHDISDKQLKLCQAVKKAQRKVKGYETRYIHMCMRKSNACGRVKEFTYRFADLKQSCHSLKQTDSSATYVVPTQVRNQFWNSDLGQNLSFSHRIDRAYYLVIGQCSCFLVYNYMVFTFFFGPMPSALYERYLG